ncbi:MAG: hypothetical protein Q8O23_01640 [Gallionella sp.]|nr:hypothetical protein [Gallionella sp.]
MTAKKQPAPGAIREAGYDTAFNSRSHTPAASCIKTLIVRLALWGLLPVALANWLIQRGGLSDA